MAHIDKASACVALATGRTARTYGALAVALFVLMLGSAAFGQAQNKDQQKCINTLNKDTGKVAATQGKNNSGCVKSATKGSPSATCVPMDGSGKVAPTETKAASDETNNGCLGANAPNFGYSSASVGNAAAVNAEIILFSDTYGGTDTTGVISTAKADAKCQSAVTKDLEKVIATKWKEYLKCKKHHAATATNASDLASCLIGLTGDAKIGAAVSKLNADISKKCGAPVSISADFPGGCFSSTTGTLAGCLDTKAECRICRALKTIDDLSIDCDLFDDGLANDSCSGQYSEVFVTETVAATQCTAWEAWRAALTDTYTSITLSGSNDPIGVTCGATAANILCQALRTNTPTSVVCDGHIWNVGGCGPGNELNVDTPLCTCPTAGYDIRPCFGYPNWGGINGATCNAATQTITVTCD
jgi:hypothetical protein